MNWAELKDIFNECELDGDKVIVKSNLAKTISFIKEKYKFDVLKSITAVDKKEQGVELTYRLYSLENEEDLLIVINVEVEIESISSIFDSATADEKEIYDLFGVKFLGNNELKRLYMPESWEGHPLKKDYQENDERLKWND